MNHIAVLLCALLTGSFLNEFTAKASFIKNRRRRDTERVYEPGLILQVYNYNRNNLFVSNSTSEAVLCISLQNKVFVLQDESHFELIVDMENSKGFKTWKGHWDLLNALPLFPALRLTLLDVFAEEQFGLNDIPEVILDYMIKVQVDLSIPFIEVDLKHDHIKGVNLLISVVAGIQNLVQGSLNGIENAIKSKIPLYVDINGLLNIMQGIDIVLGRLNKSIKDIANANVKLDLTPILGAKNGLEGLSELAKQIGSKISLLPVDSLLNNIESLVDMLAILAGYVDYGLPGLAKNTAVHIQYANKEVTLNYLVGCIVQYVAWTANAIKGGVAQEYQKGLQDLTKTLKSLNTDKSLDKALQIVNNAVKGNLILNGVNLNNAILTLINVTTQTPVNQLLTVVATTLVQLEGIIENEDDLIVYLLVEIVAKFKCFGGILQLSMLGIKLPADNPEGIQKILAPEVETFVKGGGTLYDALTSLPIVKDIINALAKAFNDASAGRINLETRLNGLDKERNDMIVGIIQVVPEVIIEISEPIKAKLEEIVEVANDVGTFIGVKVKEVVQQ